MVLVLNLELNIFGGSMFPTFMRIVLGVKK